MEEKDKILSEKMYFPFDKKLTKARKRAKTLCRKYNVTYPRQGAERVNIIKTLFGKTGEKFEIEPSIQCDYGYNIEIGENFYSNHNLVILDPAKVVFGDNVLVGPNCGFYAAEHPVDKIERQSGAEYARPIKVGNNVWIGGNVVVLGGVTIGDNVVIGAGSVVIEDLPSDTVCAGNPCKVIRNL